MRSLVAAWLVLLACPGVTAAADTKPNVVLMFLDNIGSPSCMPSRGALLTGRHPVRNGLNQQLVLIDERS